MRRGLALVGAVAGLVACAPVSLLPAVEDSLAAIEAEKQRGLVVEQKFRNVERLTNVRGRARRELTDRLSNRAGQLPAATTFQPG